MDEPKDIKILCGREEIVAALKEMNPDFVDKPINSSVVSLPSNSDWKLKPLAFDEVMADVPPPLEYVFYPCLPTEGIAIIFAAQGVGKTLFTLNIAYMIAMGGNFLNYTCDKPRKLLYVDAEMSYQNIHTRMSDLIPTHGELDFPKNFGLLTPKKVMPHKIPQIDTVEGQQKYLECIEEGEYEVIIFDNLSTLASIDENKSHEWCVVQDFFIRLRAMGKTVILVHHAGKDKEGYRGTSRMLDIVNTAISLQSLTEDHASQEEAKLKRFKVVYKKSRDFGGADSLPFEVTLSDKIWSTRTLELTLSEKVLECLNAGMNQKDIANSLKISQPTVHRIAKKLGHKRRK